MSFSGAPHAKVTQLSPGLRSAFNRFERVMRDATPEYYRAKQALIRKLLRLEGKLPPDPRGRRKKVNT